MNVEIRERNVPMDEALREYADQRLRLTLSRFANRIGRVCVQFEELDAGITRCELSVTLDHGEVLSVDDQSADVRFILDHATNRLGRLVARALERQRGAGRPPRLGNVR